MARKGGRDGGRVAIFDNLPDQRFTGKTIGKNYLPVTLDKILIRNIKQIF